MTGMMVPLNNIGQVSLKKERTRHTDTSMYRILNGTVAVPDSIG